MTPPDLSSRVVRGTSGTLRFGGLTALPVQRGRRALGDHLAAFDLTERGSMQRGTAE